MIHYLLNNYWNGPQQDGIYWAKDWAGFVIEIVDKSKDYIIGGSESEIMVAIMGSIASEKRWKKGPWTHEEDKLLSEYVSLQGEARWSSVAKFTGN